ncbi:hypothetical protein ABI59_11480 [Acidobacteria bacterium Mor1]|nr:hypothetical protein ABI59_11480 [Acidobacteria bacterium Mor1]
MISDLGEAWKATTPWENPRVELFDGKKGPVFYRRYSAGDGHALLVAEGKGKDARLAAFGSPGFDEPPPQGRSDENDAEAEEASITPPGRRVRVPLEYPWLGRLFELTGRVRVLMHLDETGAVTSVTVLNSSNPGFGFEQEAALCVGKWRYNPATRDDEPVPFDLEMLLTFRR